MTVTPVERAVEVGLELVPDLREDLVRAAALGDLAREPARPLPLRDVDREDPAGPPVPAPREVDAGPELLLRDRGQRPLGVDVDRVAVDERHVAVEVEEHPVHPARDEPVEALQARLGGPQGGRGELAHDLDGQRGDVVVGAHRAPADRRAGQPRRRDTCSASIGSPSRSSTPSESRCADPRVDPHLARRRVEHAVGAAARAREVLQQLDEDEAAGAGAHLAPARRHERAREAVGEEALEGRAAPLGARVVPPALQLPLLLAALVAAREQRQQPLDEQRVLVRRHARPARRRRAGSAPAP